MDKKLFTFDEVKQKLVDYCVYQDRSHSEVEQKMREYMLIPEAKEEIFLYLINENYLNEERFARSYTRGKFYMKKWGKIKIAQHLKAKNIGERLIKKSFQEINNNDYRDAIQQLMEKFSVNLHGLKDYQKKHKLIRFLLSKGYEYEIILESIEEKKQDY